MNEDGFIFAEILDHDPSEKYLADLALRHVQVLPHDIGNYTIPDVDAAGNMLLGLYLKLKDDEALMGSAVMIAAGIAVTASHVLEDAKNSFGTLDLETLVMRAFAYCDGQIIWWNIRAFSIVPDSDLSVLSLSLCSAPPRNYTFDIARVSLRLPRVGEPVTVGGFRQREIASTDISLKITHDLIRCTGERTDHFPDGRKGMIHGPHIGISCEVLGGMSGGPAFDVMGNLIGVVSSSLPSADGQGPTFVSLLPPAFATQFPVYWLAKEPGVRSVRLADLPDPYVHIVDRSSIAVKPNADGSVKLTYDDGT